MRSISKAPNFAIYCVSRMKKGGCFHFSKKLESRVTQRLVARKPDFSASPTGFDLNSLTRKVLVRVAGEGYSRCLRCYSGFEYLHGHGVLIPLSGRPPH
jgi:hypothetical protein